MIKFNKCLLVPLFANGKIKESFHQETWPPLLPRRLVEKPAYFLLKRGNSLGLRECTLNKSSDGLEEEAWLSTLLLCPSSEQR